MLPSTIYGTFYLIETCNKNLILSRTSRRHLLSRHCPNAWAGASTANSGHITCTHPPQFRVVVFLCPEVKLSRCSGEAPRSWADRPRKTFWAGKLSGLLLWSRIQRALQLSRECALTTHRRYDQRTTCPRGAHAPHAIYEPDPLLHALFCHVRLIRLNGSTPEASSCSSCARWHVRLEVSTNEWCQNQTRWWGSCEIIWLFQSCVLQWLRCGCIVW